MNTPDIDCPEGFPQNHEVLISDSPHLSPQYFSNQPNQNMAASRLQPTIMEAGCQQQNFGPDHRSSNSIMSRFESPASAFYATERYMGFPQYDCQVTGSSSCSQYSRAYDSQVPSHQSSGANYSSFPREQADQNFGFRSTLQSVVKSDFCGDHYYKSFEKPCKGVSSSSGNKLPSQQQNKFLNNHAASLESHPSVSFRQHEHHRVGCSSYSSPYAELGFSKQSPRSSMGIVPVSSRNSLLTAGKTRIRWNQDLHEKFVECVNRLGGAEKATPKAILKLMDSECLTIFHVKSHLQKYRIAKYIPDYSEGKAERTTRINDVTQLDVKTGFQIREALQLQLDVQRRLHEQLEIQRNLQLRIEEQGRQLKMMFDQQQKTSNSLLNNQNLDITSPDEPTFSLEDIDVSIVECSNDHTHFPSKIS